MTNQLLTTTEIRELASKLDLKPTKNLVKTLLPIKILLKRLLEPAMLQKILMF